MIGSVCITGATGAVGLALINEFLSNGVSVYAICRTDSKRIGRLLGYGDRITVLRADMSDYAGFSVKGLHADAFVHLAWNGTSGADRRDLKKQLTNVGCSLDAVDLAKRMGCHTFIGCGSQSECGHVDAVMNESTCCKPDNGYGISKLAASLMTRVRCHESGMRHIWVRLLSVYGRGDSERSLVSQALRAFRNGVAFETTKGDQIWDYMYSKDVARAFVAVAERGVDGRIYYFSAGDKRSLKDYVLSMKEVVKSRSEIVFGAIPYYANQVMHLEADSSCLKEDTGFVPKWTFEDGIRDMLSEEAL
jgi:nucleoside-diphosphate-sugar epimerase